MINNNYKGTSGMLCLHADSNMLFFQNWYGPIKYMNKIFSHTVKLFDSLHCLFIGICFLLNVLSKIEEDTKQASLILSIQNPFPMVFRKLICKPCFFIAFIC